MKSSKLRIFGLVLGAVLLTAVKLWASDPVGIYAVIEKVVLEPSENSPQRIQIWGAFALTDGLRGSNYQKAQRGVLYYTLPAGKEEIAKKEWADLKAVAGTGQVVGFGFRYDTKTHVRKTADKAESPDVYPTGFGVVKMGNNPYKDAISAGLKEALRSR